MIEKKLLVSREPRLANDLFWLMVDELHDRLRLSAAASEAGLAAALLAELVIQDGSVAMRGGVVSVLRYQDPGSGVYWPAPPRDPVALAVYDRVVAEPNVRGVDERLAVLARDSTRLVAWRLAQAGALTVTHHRRRAASYRSLDMNRSGTPAVRLRLRWKRSASLDRAALFADLHDLVLCSIAAEIGLIGELVGDGVPDAVSAAVVRHVRSFVAATDSALGPLLSLIAPLVSDGVLSFRR